MDVGLRQTTLHAGPLTPLSFCGSVAEAVDKGSGVNFEASLGCFSSLKFRRCGSMNDFNKSVTVCTR